MNGRVIVSEDEFQLEELKQKIITPSDRAVVVFNEVVREHYKGERIKNIELQRYEGITLQELERVRDEAINNFEVNDIIIHHRYGEFQVGENLVGIVVSANKRKEAFDACRYCIDRMKEIVPLWNKRTTVSEDENSAERHE